MRAGVKVVGFVAVVAIGIALVLSPVNYVQSQGYPGGGEGPTRFGAKTITESLTIGTGTEADRAVIFDGNAEDFHIGLDDSADSLIIGLGSVLGTTEYISMANSSQGININNDNADINFTIHSDNSALMFGIDAGRNNLALLAAPATGGTFQITPGVVGHSVVTSFGTAINIFADTLADSSATDPIAIATQVFLGIPTYSDADKVYTTATNLYIQGAAAVTGGASITNAYALYVDAGISRLDGGVVRAIQAVVIDGVTTFAITSDHITLACTGAETVNTITGGEAGMRLFIEHTDTDCVIADDDAVTAANAIDLVGTGTDNTGAAKKYLMIVYDGTAWVEIAGSDN